MKIVISKLPDSGWWSRGIPKYDDNPAMKKGLIPNHALAEKERKVLISAIKKSGHNILEFDFPLILDQQNPKHDFVFIRDSFISNQMGTAIILRAGEPSRRIENQIVTSYLESLDIKIIEMPDKKGIRADGGEFYFCREENVLFCGLKRNTMQGATFVAEKFNVAELVIIEGNGYHLDTFFTPVLDKKGCIIALIACKKMLSKISESSLCQFAKSRNIPLIDIPQVDSLGTASSIGNFAANALPLPGVLIRANRFTDLSVEEKLRELEIKSFITPTSQFQLSGGSVHCITNEL
tara:strand:- start:1627 stop:2505 length:879 start_codon:yes stop_codon:yes gene_type:complete